MPRGAECSHLALMVDGSYVIRHISYSQEACLMQIRRHLLGRKCYEVLWKLEKPCSGCPLKKAEYLDTSTIVSHFRQGTTAQIEGIVSESLLHLYYHRLFYPHFSKYGLTHTEQEVALFILKGLSSKRIADRLLFISKKSADFHRHNIRKKLGLSGKRVSIANFLQSLIQEDSI